MMMQKFEYKTIEITASVGLSKITIYTDHVDEIFSELGEQGWELVTSVPANYVGMMSFKVYYTFKRVIQ